MFKVILVFLNSWQISKMIRKVIKRNLAVKRCCSSILEANLNLKDIVHFFCFVVFFFSLIFQLLVLLLIGAV